MDGSNYLQIFLLFNIFIMGIVASIAARHAYAHFKPQVHEVEKPQHPHAQTVQLSPEIKERLLQKSQMNFQAVLDHAASELQRDLKITTLRLDKQLEKIGDDVIESEMKRYHDGLEKIRIKTESAINDAGSEITKHQDDLKAKLEEKQIELEKQMTDKINAEQQMLIQNIDTKLADAVASFLTETLKHNVDLGAQSSYLVSLLEEHKNEIKKDVS